jgi:tripartite-type tricarboxylate transporter receptor subunit TctC
MLRLQGVGQMNLNKFRLALCLAICSLQAWVPAQAQVFPARPVRLLVGLAAGGPTDLAARILAAKLTEVWGQQVVVENRAGAGSTIAAEAVARAPADGHTLLLCTIATHALAPQLIKSLSYDPVKDFAPISMVGITPNILVVHPSVPANTLKEFLALAKASPGKLTYASSGIGNSPHLTMELLKTQAGIDLVHVPFKGSAPAMTELLSGRIQSMFDNLPGQVENVKAGKVRALGVTSLQRSAQLPDVPPIAEAGLPGFDVSVWYGVCAPSATPMPVQAKVHADLIAALGAPDLRQRLAGAGVDAKTSSQAEFARFISAEAGRWGEVIRKAGIKPD